MAKKESRLPSGKYRYRLYLGTGPDGKKKYKSFTADTLKKARKAAQTWQAVHPSDGPDISLGDACDRFLEGRSGTLSPSTWADYKHRIDYMKKAFPDFFKLPVASINAERMQWLASMLATKRSDNNPEKFISAKTVDEYYSRIKTVLRMNGIHIDGVHLPQKQKPQLNIPENELIKQLLVSLEGNHLEIPVLLAALGPMRRSEIGALTMDDIDFERNIVHVRKDMVRNYSRKWIVKYPKTPAGTRDILYPPVVIEKIRQQGYVTHCNPDTISGNFVRHLKRHGFPSFRFHDLRHYAASFLLALNIPAVYVMQRGGWESAQTMRRYVHALEEQKQQYAQQATTAFQDLL